MESMKISARIISRWVRKYVRFTLWEMNQIYRGFGILMKMTPWSSWKSDGQGVLVGGMTCGCSIECVS